MASAEAEDQARPFKDWPNDAGFDTLAEQCTGVELAVTGSLPASVAGTLYRTGPGCRRVAGSDYTRSHWFDGFTTVHRFQLEAQAHGSCRVWYSSRRQVDALMDKARRQGNLHDITFGQRRDPCESLFQKVKAMFMPTARTLEAGLVEAGITIRPDVRRTET